MFKKPENIAFIVLSIFIVAYKLLFHEMWKDEWQAWFVATEMPLQQMFQFLYYDGHPSVWYLYLKFWGLFTPWIESEYLLQIAHALVFVSFLYVFIIKIKFPLWWKIILFGGYFIWYEYGIINRGYAMLMLFSAILLHWIQIENKKTWQYALVLILLCNTEVFGVFLAASFMLYFLHNYFVNKTQSKAFLGQVISGFFIGVISFYITMKPASDKDNVTYYYFNNFNFNQILKAIQGCWTNTFYIELFGDLNSVGYNPSAVIIGVLLIIVSILFFWKDKSVMLSWSAFAVIFTLFTAAFYIGGVRQWGVLLFSFFLFVMLFWYKHKLEVWQKIFLISICVFQYIHSARIFVFDIQSPFSNSKKTGLFIRDNIDEKTPVIVVNKAFAVPVSGYAERKFITLPDEKPFSIFRWREPMYFPSIADLYVFMIKYKYRKIYFLHHKPLSYEQYGKMKTEEKFDEKSVKDEKYYIYSLSM